MKKFKLISLLTIVMALSLLCACGHVHTYSSAYSSNAQKHWKDSTCEHELKSEVGQHTFDQGVVNSDKTLKVFTCSVCGYQKSEAYHEHAFASDYTKDETYHWYASTCGHEVVDSKAEHTFDQGVVNGDKTLKVFTCSVCGYQKSEAYHEHAFASDYTKDETYHWFASTCGHEVVDSKAEHTFDNGVVNSDKTLKVFTCSVCGYQKSEAYHEHAFASDYTKDETHHWYASTCGHEVVDSKAEHTFDGGVEQSNGNVLYTCTVCEYEKTVVHNHTFATEYSTSETHHWFASTCGHEVVDSKAEHTFDGGVESNGIIIYSCIDCAFKKVDVTYITVSELLSSELNGQYTIKGVVANVATVYDRNEIILIDNATGDAISITNLGEGHVYIGSYYVEDIKVGDEVIIPVKLLKEASSSSANSNKLYAEFTGDSYSDVIVISENNQINYKNSEVVIDSQADLVNFLSSANRELNVNKVVKFKGQMNLVMDNDYESYDFWMFDGNVLTQSDLAIDGLVPTISNPATYFTLNKLVHQILLNNDTATKANVQDPHVAILEFKMMYIGGNNEFAQFILLSDEVATVTPAPTGIEFTAPNKLDYVVGDEIDFTGSKIITHYDYMADTITETTASHITNMPVLNTAGNYTISGVYEGFNFDFEIKVYASKVESVVLYSLPTVSTYSHRYDFNTIDISGAKLKVTFENGAEEIVDITREMVLIDESDAWKIGTVNYKVSYLENVVDLPIVYENTALTVSQLKASTVGNTYELTGVVVGAVSSISSADLLIKEKNSNECIAITNTGVVGAYDSLKLDTTTLNVGDEITVTITLNKYATAGGGVDRLYAIAESSEQFKSNVKILSTSNSAKFDLTQATTFSEQAKFKSFVTNTTQRHYQLVKLVGVRFKRLSNVYSAVFLSDCTASTQAKDGSRHIVIDRRTSNKFVTLTNFVPDIGSSNSKYTYENPVVSEYDVYALYIGGNGTYLSLLILDADWFVPASANA